jgi:hypothetical protein
MANPEHVEILKQGVEVWNKWRKENPKIEPDLSNSDLKNYNLQRANLRWTILAETNLMGMNLSFIDFNHSDLTGSNLNECDLSFSNLDDTCFKYAKLNQANLSLSQLWGSEFTRTQLNQTNFDRVTIGFNSFLEVDLSLVQNLDKAIHLGPSYIDISSLNLSKGKIPEIFLRGCGVPDNFIGYIKSLSAASLGYYSCFISYSSKDQDFADRLYADLQSKGVRCWFAPEDMKIGDKIRDRIDQSIRIHDKLLLILSEQSINSEWVEDEVESAYEQEKKRSTTVLFPVRIDNSFIDTDKGWAAKLRGSRHIGDFTKWEVHDSYQKAFDRLLRDLKTERE